MSDDSKKNTIDNAMKAYGQGDSTAGGAQPQDQVYSQYQQYYNYGQYPNQSGAYNYQTNPAYAGQYNYQQYNQYYQQYYGQQQNAQNYYQYPYGAAQGAQNSYYNPQSYATPQSMPVKQNVVSYGIPPQSAAKPATATTSSSYSTAQASSKPSQPEQMIDPLLDEIKRTVLNDQRINKKSRWSQEVVIPSDIYDQFDKKSDKKKFDFDLLNLLNEQQKQAFTTYVKKCFDKCQNAKEQQLMSSMLLTNLTTIIFKKSFDTVKWDTYYMPLLPREKDKPVSTPSQFAIQTSTSSSTTANNTLTIPGFSMPGQGSYMGGGQPYQN